MSLRLRIIPARHPYGHWVWSYEVYDPERPQGGQVIASCGWLASWNQARRRGCAELLGYQTGLLGPESIEETR